jgi:hypothetical protein
MAGSGFAVSVKLIDFASGPLAKINQAIGAVEKTAKRAARDGGLYEVRDALSNIRKEAGEVADKLGGVFTPLGGLTAAGSLAGMASLAERFARVGNEISRTSDLFGVGSRELQNWRGAMRLAGGEAEDATALIGNVGRALYLARAGLNQKAILGAAQFKLDVSKPDLEFILDMADKLKGLAPQQRRQFATIFDIDERSLAYLDLGREAIVRLNEEAQRHGFLNKEQQRQAVDLHHAYVGLALSVESTSNAIGSQIGQWLTPMLTKWSEWLDRARETPAVMKSVEIGVDALAVAMGVTLVGSLAKVLWWANAVWATPLFRFLGPRAGMAALGGLGGAGELQQSVLRGYSRRTACSRRVCRSSGRAHGIRFAAESIGGLRVLSLGRRICRAVRHRERLLRLPVVAAVVALCCTRPIGCPFLKWRVAPA